MTGGEFLIVGGLLFCNLGTLAWMMRNNSQISKKKVEPDISSGEVSPTTEGEKNVANEPDSSETCQIVDKALEDLSNKFMEAIPRLITSALGDVDINDVIFGKTNEEETTTIHPADNSIQLNSDQIKDAFETDIRDVDPLPPSAPDTAGHSFEELEESIEIALDSASSDEEKAHAGKVLKEYESTQMFDILRSNDEIGKRVDFCLTLALKMEIAEKNSSDYKVKKGKPSKNKPVTSTQIVKSKRKEGKINLENIDIDQFNPADLLKK